MKKEVLIAVIVGFSLGLIITFGIYRAQKSLSDRAANKNATEESTQIDSTSNISLSITQPEDGSITDKDTITVGGIAKKNSLITVISPEDHQATQADELGNFSVEFSLEVGENQIHIKSVSDDNTKQEKTISVVYSSYEFDDEPKAIETENE
jgi:hypothetical protein